MARHRVGVVECSRLFEVQTEAPRAHFHGGDGALVVELLDRPKGAIGDVEAPVTLPKLDAVAHGEATLLDPLHREGPAVARIDEAGEAACLQLEPQQVLPLVDRDDPRTLAGFDALATAHEAQHVAHAVARRAAPLLGRQVLPDHHLRLDALSLYPAGLDECLSDAAIEVRPLGVARDDHHATAAVRDEIPRDLLVPQAGIRDLQHPAGAFEELHGTRGAALLRGGPDCLAEGLVSLPADHVQALGRDPRPVDQQREGRARLHRAMLLPVAHQHDLGPHFLGPAEQLSRLATRQEARLIHDPELRLSLKGRGSP
jgi:hypothetical protein